MQTGVFQRIDELTDKVNILAAVVNSLSPQVPTGAIANNNSQQYVDVAKSPRRDQAAAEVDGATPGSSWMASTGREISGNAVAGGPPSLPAIHSSMQLCDRRAPAEKGKQHHQTH
jgi:hypothetical protein